MTFNWFDSSCSYLVFGACFLCGVGKPIHPKIFNMKTANQAYVDNKVKTEITCNDCGNRTYVKARINTVTVEKSLTRPCRSFNPPSFLLVNVGWWKEFGLDSNPYVYGPMPRLRTGREYRMEEARRMGWMSWTWQDEYTEDRKRTSQYFQKNKIFL